MVRYQVIIKYYNKSKMVSYTIHTVNDINLYTLDNIQFVEFRRLDRGVTHHTESGIHLQDIHTLRKWMAEKAAYDAQQCPQYLKNLEWVKEV